MNVFNRVVVVLFLILLIPILALVILGAAVPGLVVTPLRQTLAGWETPALNTQVTTILVAAGLLVLDLILLFLEFRRSAPQTVRLSSVAGGQAVLSTTSIEQRLAQAISLVPDVVKVKPTVLGRRNGVEVVLDLETHPQVDVPAKTDEVVAIARDVVETQIGLRMEKVKVNLRLSERGGKRPSQQPPMVLVQPPATPVQTPAPPQEGDPGSSQ
jgi:hypothetical protein